MIGCMVVVIGLASRQFASMLPSFIGDYLGDTLWALMVFVGIGFLFTRWSSQRVAIVALLFSYAIEVSQLYHAPWIDSLRHTRFGGLVLGYGFLWSDILCYTVGVATGFLIEVVMQRKTA